MSSHLESYYCCVSYETRYQLFSDQLFLTSFHSVNLNLIASHSRQNQGKSFHYFHTSLFQSLSLLLFQSQLDHHLFHISLNRIYNVKLTSELRKISSLLRILPRICLIERAYDPLHLTSEFVKLLFLVLCFLFPSCFSFH